MRTFAANFITQKNAEFAKPFLIGRFASSLGTAYISDKTRTVNGQLYLGIVEYWGSLGTSLSGFGEAFAAPGTTVQLTNMPELASGTRRFSSYIPRFCTTVDVQISWCFQHPDSATIYTELALRGPIVTIAYDYVSATIELRSRAEQIMNRDILETMDHTDCPDSNIGRPLPIMVNRAAKVPIWIYSGDRSRFAVAEDIRPAATYALSGVYYQGVRRNQGNTSAG